MLYIKFDDGYTVDAAILSFMEQKMLTNEVDLKDHYEYFEECYSEGNIF
jgi:hypothetical protein